MLMFPHSDPVLEQSYIWKTAFIELFIDGNVPRNMPQLCRLSGNAPQLRVLGLTALDLEDHMICDVDADDLPLCCPLMDLPELAVVTLAGPFVDVVDLLWNQLEALALRECCEAHRVAEILLKCSQLDRLALSYHPEATPCSLAFDLTLPHLQFFAYDDRNTIDLPNIPCSAKLEVLDVPHDGLSLSRIQTMINLSSCSLTSLRLTDNTAFTNHQELYVELQEVLQVTPSLKQLSFGFQYDQYETLDADNCWGGDPLFALLTVHHGQPALCPLLERLDAESIRFTADTLLLMLYSRVPSRSHSQNRTEADRTHIDAIGQNSRQLEFLRVTACYPDEDLEPKTTFFELFSSEQQRTLVDTVQGMKGVNISDRRQGQALSDAVRFEEVLPGIKSLFP